LNFAQISVKGTSRHAVLVNMAQTKMKAAFIDHSFHKKTSSNAFIKELLSETFDLTYYYDESWIGGKKVNIDTLKNSNYEYIFYWQVIHDVRELKKLKNKKIIWFPMWDEVVGMSTTGWLLFRTIPIKIVCFSKTLYDKLKNLEFNCRYFQYFMNPETLQIISDFNTKRVYFWIRTEELTWDIIKKKIRSNNIDSLTFMAVPDPKHSLVLPTEEDIKKYNIKIYEQFLEQDEYQNLVSKANIYIAPRKHEGIGMSFLEALCRGQCVIAPNTPTMNEYIKDGENGYLYDLDDRENLKELDLSDFELIAKTARKRAVIGYKIWQQQKVELVEYINNDKNFYKSSEIVIFLKIKYLQTYSLITKMYRLMTLIINKFHF